MGKFVSFCKTLVAYTIGFICLFFFTIICLPFAALPASIRFDNKIYFWITWLWAKCIVAACGIRIKIIGKENIPQYPDSPAIILANHVSALDIPLVETLLNQYPHAWISKHIYGKIPVFGFLMHRMHILLNREDEGKAVSVLKNSYKRVNGKDRHLVMFPEGRRYCDGKVHEFQQGFALLVAKLDRPVIPIAIWGLHKVYPKGSLLVDSSAYEVKISIGKPMLYDKSGSRTEFVERVHAWFTQEITKLSK